MSTSNTIPASNSSHKTHHSLMHNWSLKFLLCSIFFFSGLSALIFQISWQRLLTVYYGVGMVSITLIVSVYMLGLGCGALIGGWLAEKSLNHIRLYFWVELMVAIIGALSFPCIMAIGQLTATSPYLYSLIFKVPLLLIPTIFMGMSLPILVKIFTQILPDFTRALSILYFVNTLGASIGALVGSYILISFLGIHWAIYIAAAINFFLAITILITSKIYKAKLHKLSRISHFKLRVISPITYYAHWIVFITGFLAIGYEIIWFRVIGVLIKASPYSFSSVLAVYLLGIAIGSFVIGRRTSKLTIRNKVKTFYFLQAALGLSVAILFIGYYYLTKYSPLGELTAISFLQPVHPPAHFLFFDHHINSIARFLRFIFLSGTVLIWPLFFVLIPTLFIGASFPLITSLAVNNKSSIAQTTGRIYFFNILGNVLGGLVTGFFLLPFLGSEPTLLLFILIGLLFALPLLEKKSILTGYVPLLLTVALIFGTFPRKSELYSVMHTRPEGYTQYFEEGLDGIVMTYINNDNTVLNYINGDSHGGRPGYSFYVQVIEAINCARKAENILVIGYGTGSITEGALKIPGVKKVTIVELNSTLLKNLEKIPLFRKLLSDQHLNIVLEDGRRFLNNQQAKYDLIFLSPLRTTTAYSNNLYSKQFYELLLSSLSPTGIVSTWTNEDTVIFKTLASVFQHIRLYTTNDTAFFLASPLPLEEQDKNRLIPLASSFNNEDWNNIHSTGQKYKIISGESLLKYTQSAPINQDWHPVTEYFIGLRFSQKEIYKKNYAQSTQSNQ
ncbi:MAG: fused MFS/spermidine synthase [Candidatus Omnitrophica bacterium]|nr:fused MFS/spermidine synthase [Candidatus Omnitrophota bacterium]